MKQVNLIKIGSESVNSKNIQKLSQDISKIREQTGEGFIIVSSGSKAIGEESVKSNGKESSNFSKNALCSIGQSLIMQMYRELMQKDILIAQILLDDWQNKDFINSILLHFKGSSKILKLANMLIDYLNGKKDEQFIKTLNDLVFQDVIAIINHNDALSSQELNKLSSKTDNDNNVVHICQAVDNFSRLISFRIRRVIYLTNTNGLLDNNGETLKGGEVDFEKDEGYYISFVRQDKSSKGTGGMGSKVKGSFQALRYGVSESIISNSSDGLEALNGNGQYTIFKGK